MVASLETREGNREEYPPIPQPKHGFHLAELGEAGNIHPE